MGRAPCCDKPEEDAKLKAYIGENGTGGNWIALPQKIGLKRCGKSCRLRWLNYLRPNIIHGGFSEEDDQIICNLYISIGSRWSIIAAQLPGRTDNDIKNYWNTRLKKKLLGQRKEPSHPRCGLSLNQELNSEANRSDNSDDGPLQTLSSTALERMQLHLQLQGLSNCYFYNNPALWPKFHPLGSSRLFHGQPAANPLPEPVHQSLIPNKPAAEPNHAPVTASMQEDFCGSSNINSVADGLQAELQNLIYGINGIAELDSFQEMNGQAKDNVDWWAGNRFDDKSPSSWDSASALQSDSVLQDYVLGYDL